MANGDGTMGIYVHIPFCVRKCLYCDFNSYPLQPGIAAAYLDALMWEIEQYRGQATNCQIESLFIGGGTPTVLSGNQLSQVINQCRKTFAIDAAAEITVECNPGTVDQTKLYQLKAAGVNRLSFGVQDFHDCFLQKLGRIHSVEQLYANYRLARTAGFHNINFDLIFGLPDQTLADWRETLKCAVELGPDHLSAYGLQIEAGTPFAAMRTEGRLRLPGEETEAKMYEWAMDYLHDNGYHHYEISNFSKKGKQCRHNLRYWHNCDYFGFGAGAHSALDGTRYANELSPEKYIQMVRQENLPIAWRETITTSMSMTETMMLGLRLAEGVSNRYFCKRYGHSLTEVYGDSIHKLVTGGLITYDGERVMLTRRGLLLANLVIEEFVL